MQTSHLKQKLDTEMRSRGVISLIPFLWNAGAEVGLEVSVE